MFSDCWPRGCLNHFDSFAQSYQENRSKCFYSPSEIRESKRRCSLGQQIQEQQKWRHIRKPFILFTQQNQQPTSYPSNSNFFSHLIYLSFASFMSYPWLTPETDNFLNLTYKRLLHMSSTFSHLKLIPVSNESSNISWDHPQLSVVEGADQPVTLTIDASNINRALEILAWRFKTSLPIVKATHFALSLPSQVGSEMEQKVGNRSQLVFQKKGEKRDDLLKQAQKIVAQHPNAPSYTLLVKIETIKIRLCNLSILPLPQVLYLMKEMLVGFEVLIGRFGVFQPEESMVVVDSHDHWKIWVSDILQSNKTQNIRISQKQFIYKLILIAERHCVNNSLANVFFTQAKEITYSQSCTFHKMCQCIREFVHANKLFQVTKVTIPKEKDWSPLKSLTKKKGYHRIEQMACSLIDGKYVPKEDMSPCPHSENNFFQSSQTSFENSPQRRIPSIQWYFEKRTSLDAENRLEFYTPREKIGSEPIQVYTPLINKERQNFVRPATFFTSPRLEPTTANSKIEQRRRSEQASYFGRFKVVEEEEAQEPIFALSRKPGLRDLSEGVQSACDDPKGEMQNSASTELRDVSELGLNCTLANRQLKMKDCDFKTRNNQRSYMDFSGAAQPKHLTVSHVPRHHQLNTPVEQAPPKWNNTISGLFSDSTSIRQLKTSIRIKSAQEKKEKQQDRGFASQLHLLGKMGRMARQSLVNEEDSDQQDQEVSTDQPIEFKEDSSALNVSRDSQEQQILPQPRKAGTSKPFKCAVLFLPINDLQK